MKVSVKRWGEVTVKKQAKDGKNKFDATKSFSVIPGGHEYTIDQYKELLEIITNLTEIIPFNQLRNKLKAIQ